MSCQLDLSDLRHRLGGQVYDGGRRWIGPGPNHSRRDASLSVWINEAGRPLVFSFANDPFPACAKHLGIEGAERASPSELIRLKAERQAAEAHRRAEAAALVSDLWSEAQPVAGTPAEAYLASRCIAYDRGELRFHPAAIRSRRPDGPPRHPAMLGLVRQRNGIALGLHATYLTANGQKALGHRSRLMFGVCASGAVQLRPVAPDGALAVAEGIETAESFHALFGVPTWAALSTSGLQQFDPPPEARHLIVAVDSDDSGAGLEAGRKLAERVRPRLDVTIAPAPQGKDWNDVRGEQDA